MASSLFFLAIPSKAIEILDGCVQRVTPESSLRNATAKAVDGTTGLPMGDSAFTAHALDLGGVAVAADQSTVHLYTSDTQTVVMQGALTAACRATLVEQIEADAAGLNDAGLVGRLFAQYQPQKHKYAFLGLLEGAYALALYDSEADIALAARDASGRYTLSQVRLERTDDCPPPVRATAPPIHSATRGCAPLGADDTWRLSREPETTRGVCGCRQGVDKTGGLLISNGVLPHDYALTPIPEGNFIFGKFRQRNLHVVRPRSLRPEFDSRRFVRPSSPRAPAPGARAEMYNIKRRMCAGSAPTAASRRDRRADALSTPQTTKSTDPPTPSVQIPAAPNSTVDTSAMHEAERAAARALSGLAAGASSDAVLTSSRLTTTPSRKGTADRRQSWRASPGTTSVSPAVAAAASANTTPSAKGTADAQRSWRRKSVGRKAPGLAGWGKMDAKRLVEVAMDYEEEELQSAKNPSAPQPTWRRPGSLADVPPNATNPLVQHAAAEVPEESGLMEALDMMVGARGALSSTSALYTSSRAERLSVETRRSLSSRTSIGERAARLSTDEVDEVACVLSLGGVARSTSGNSNSSAAAPSRLSLSSRPGQVGAVVLAAPRTSLMVSASRQSAHMTSILKSPKPSGSFDSAQPSSMAQSTKRNAAA